MRHLPQPQPGCGVAHVARITGSAALAAIIVAAPANAGGKMDDPFEYPIVEAPAPAPPAPARYSWDGAYGGFSLGYAFAGDDEVGFRGDNINGNRIIGDLRLDGPFVGVQVGRNWHRHSDDIVFGVEGSVALGRISSEVASGDNSASSDIKAKGAVRGRLGYALNRDLVYVSGGLAAARVEYEATSAEGDSLDDTRTKVGYTLGVGWETALDDEWTVRGEYNYSNYGGYDLDGTNNLETRATPDHHSISVGVNRRF